uniref:Uncharacterized protein n=2 Tax=viral metagenome TaxID=1070528 RepID=A0A6M3IZ50_9ZZZZ
MKSTDAFIQFKYRSDEIEEEVTRFLSDENCKTKLIDILKFIKILIRSQQRILSVEKGILNITAPDDVKLISGEGNNKVYIPFNQELGLAMYQAYLIDLIEKNNHYQKVVVDIHKLLDGIRIPKEGES